MKFDEIEYGYQKAFISAWNAFKRGTTPIGCAIVTNHGTVISCGENSIYAKDNNEIISAHPLAHAEINAILKFSIREHPNIRDYILYTTMEPCPLCFGAIVQSYIRRVRYAAKDGFAGAVCLNNAMEYIISQKIEINGPDEILQILQIALVIYRRLELNFTHNDQFFEMYQLYCPEGIDLGNKLFSDNSFNDMVKENILAEVIYDYILGLYT